jgi:hypothetical protein
MVEMSAVLGLLAGPAGSGGTVVVLTVQVVLLVVALIFGLDGLRRGAQRELLLTIGIVFASVLVQSKVGYDWLVFWANRMYKLVLFVLGGGMGASDPSAAWAKVRALPDLFNTAQKQLYLTLIFFVIIVLLAYLGGRTLRVKEKLRIEGEGTSPGGRALPRNSTMSGCLFVLVSTPSSLPFFNRLLGLVIGAINGYLVMRFWLPRLLPTTKTVVVIPSGSVADFLSTNINYAFIAIVAVLVFLAWQASTGKSK